MPHGKGSSFAFFALIFLLGTACAPESGEAEPGDAEILHAEIGQAEKEDLESEVLAEPLRLEVLSWNIKGNAARDDPDHVHNVAEMIREIAPDVALLQEVHRETLAAGGLDQFAILAEGLGMSGCFGESLEVGEGTYGNAILTTGTVQTARRFLLPGGGEPRIVLECVSRWNELDVPLMTTHLTAWDRANRRTRGLQVGAIGELLDDHISPLVMIGGDFNAWIGSPELTRLARSDKMSPVIDRYVVTHRGTGRQYDHLFVGDGWRIEGSEVVRRGPSDHWPLLARLVQGGAGDE